MFIITTNQVLIKQSMPLVSAIPKPLNLKWVYIMEHALGFVTKEWQIYFSSSALVLGRAWTMFLTNPDPDGTLLFFFIGLGYHIVSNIVSEFSFLSCYPTLLSIHIHWFGTCNILVQTKVHEVFRFFYLKRKKKLVQTKKS